MGFPSPQSDKVSVCLCIFHRSRVVRTRETRVFRAWPESLYLHVRPGPSCLFWTCWQRSPQGLWSDGPAAEAGPPPSCICLKDKPMTTEYQCTSEYQCLYVLEQQSDKFHNRVVIEPSVDPWCLYTVYQPASLSSTPLWSMRVPLTRLLKGSKAVMLSIAGCFFPRYS